MTSNNTPLTKLNTPPRQRRPSTAGGGLMGNEEQIIAKKFSTPQVERKAHSVHKRSNNKLITAKLINSEPRDQNTDSANTKKKSTPQTGRSRTGQVTSQKDTNDSRQSAGSARPLSSKSRPLSGNTQNVETTSHSISRPRSGQSRSITDNVGISEEITTKYSSRPPSSSMRPKSGVSRPPSAVSRKSITSRKDSLLSKHGGSSSNENALYGKAEDEELERYMTPVRPKSGKPVSASVTLGEKATNDSTNEKYSSSAPVTRQHSLEHLPPISKISNGIEDRPTSSKSTTSMHERGGEEGRITQRSTTTEAFGDDSDDELKLLAQQLDDGIYDPLASLPNLPRYSAYRDSKNSTKDSPIERTTTKSESVNEDTGQSKPVDEDGKNNGGENEASKKDDLPGDSRNSVGKGEDTKDNDADKEVENGDITEGDKKDGENSEQKEDKNENNGEKGEIDRNVENESENLGLDLGDDGNTTIIGDDDSDTSVALAQEVEEGFLKKPKWHPPWQLRQEIVAHEGAIPELVVDPTNRWFATGSQDKTIRLWDINTGRQKLVIKAHKREVRALAFGPKGHRMLFSTGDDRQLLCHDVEVNRVVSRFSGQSSVIYDMAFYHAGNLLITCGRDKLLKVFDVRTKKIVRSMRGHTNTVSCVEMDPFNKMVISGSHDATVRLWDIGDGRCINTLYGHNKSVRALCCDPEGKKFLSSSSELIVAWDLPMGDMIQEIPASDLAINSITLNQNGVVVAGGANGYMNLWDFESGFRFQRISRARVYESHELPICVFATKFDQSGKKLICSDACNVVKIYGEAYHTKVGLGTSRTVQQVKVEGSRTMITNATGSVNSM